MAHFRVVASNHYEHSSILGAIALCRLEVAFPVRRIERFLLSHFLNDNRSTWTPELDECWFEMSLRLQSKV
jgi:hypothetical protein